MYTPPLFVVERSGEDVSVIDSVEALAEKIEAFDLDGSIEVFDSRGQLVTLEARGFGVAVIEPKDVHPPEQRESLRRSLEEFLTRLEVEVDKNLTFADFVATAAAVISERQAGRSWLRRWIRRVFGRLARLKE